jgi:hypothetical protein
LSTAPRSVPTIVAVHAASATHPQARAKSAIHGLRAAVDTLKLHTEYIPSGNTVDQRWRS